LRCSTAAPRGARSLLAASRSLFISSGHQKSPISLTYPRGLSTGPDELDQLLKIPNDQRRRERYIMKTIRIAGLCVVAIFVMSVVAAETASATTATWQSCREGAPGTKYEEGECVKASGTGKWGWEEVKGTEAAIAFGTLALADTKVPVVGEVEVGCTSETLGSVGPGKLSRIEKMNKIECSAGKGCEKIVGTPEPRNLPWRGELAETEGKSRDNITNGKTGEAAPGWAVTCRVLSIEKTDVCTFNDWAITPDSRLTFNGNTNSFESLVLLEAESAVHANCTIGGSGSGSSSGSVPLLSLSSNVGLRFVQ
jgi:hypothetical protein